MKTILFFTALIILIVFLGFNLRGSVLNEDDAIDAIVGEASNQSYDTMICVAQALHHRGTLKGVYGLHASHNAFENKDVRDAAEEAWESADAIPDKVKGAKNWGTLDDLKKLHVKQYKVKCGVLYFY